MANVTVSIAMPEEMKAYVDERIKSKQFGNVSEYFRNLVREDARRAADERLLELLIEGENSGEPIPVTPEWWERKRAELLERAGKIARKKRA